MEPVYPQIIHLWILDDPWIIQAGSLDQTQLHQRSLKMGSAVLWTPLEGFLKPREAEGELTLFPWASGKALLKVYGMKIADLSICKFGISRASKNSPLKILGFPPVLLLGGGSWSFDWNSDMSFFWSKWLPQTVICSKRGWNTITFINLERNVNWEKEY